MLNPMLYSETAAGEYLGLTRRTLAYWRHIGEGPKFMKVGRRVFYGKDDLDSFLDSNRFQSTSEVKQAS